jgi:hypothetical protein
MSILMVTYLIFSSVAAGMIDFSDVLLRLAW